MCFDCLQNLGFDFGMVAELLPAGERDSKRVSERLEVVLVWQNEANDIRLQSTNAHARIVDARTELDGSLDPAECNVFTVLEFH